MIQKDLNNIRIMSEDEFEQTEYNPNELYFVEEDKEEEADYISKLSMPSNRYIDLTLGASETVYTAPANGYFALQKKPTSNDQYMAFKNISASDYTQTLPARNASATVSGVVPCKKGDKVMVLYTLAGNTVSFKFIYAEGAR